MAITVILRGAVSGCVARWSNLSYSGKMGKAVIARKVIGELL